MISAQSTPTNNGVQSIYFVGEGQGDCNISTHRRSEATASKPRRFVLGDYVSTHSHPKVAAEWIAEFGDEQPFQHTAARRRLPQKRCLFCDGDHVSTHSRAEAAADKSDTLTCHLTVSTHSRAEAAAWILFAEFNFVFVFQHTAARRRLQFALQFLLHDAAVSTHSRAEAAACGVVCCKQGRNGFNTQPRGGGCLSVCRRISV